MATNPLAANRGDRGADDARSGATGYTPDRAAVRRFAAIARRAGRELEPAATLDAVVRIAELVPRSATVPAWCESACSAAELVQRLAGCFESLARRAECALVDPQARDGEFGAAAASFAVVLA